MKDFLHNYYDKTPGEGSTCHENSITFFCQLRSEILSCYYFKYDIFRIVIFRCLACVCPIIYLMISPIIYVMVSALRRLRKPIIYHSPLNGREPLKLQL